MKKNEQMLFDLWQKYHPNQKIDSVLHRRGTIIGKWQRGWYAVIGTRTKFLGTSIKTATLTIKSKSVSLKSE